MKFPINFNGKNSQSSKYLVLIPGLKEEKTQKFTTTIFTIIALIFFSLFAINPTLSTIANLQKQLEDNKFVDKKLEEKISNLYALQGAYSNLQNDLPFVYSAIPDKSQIPNLSSQIQVIAKQSNLLVSGFSTMPVDLSDDLINNKKYSVIEFSIGLSGSYGDIKNFITKLNNMERIILLEGSAITKTGIANSTQLNIDIRAVAYFKK